MGTTALSEARDHATAHVPTARPGDLVEDLRVGLVGAHFECADDVAVVADGVLVGMLPIERVFAASDLDRVADVMDPDPPAVSPGVDQEHVAWEMVRRGESSAAVVDEDRRLIGLVPPHRDAACPAHGA
jgi:magnesium transporter